MVWIFVLILITILALMFTDATITSLLKNYGYAAYSGVIALLLWAIVVSLVEGLFFYA